MQIAKKTLSVFLAMLMVFGTFAVGGAGLALTASADDTNKAIRLVTNGALDGIEGAQQNNVWFGNYKQSGDGAGGFNVDPIKWRVLSNADGKLFLLADKNLDVVQYNGENTSITWEACTLRKWLNGYDGHPYDDTFIGNAFSDKEAAAIAETAVVNDNNPDYGTSGGNDTTDKVFLLSIAEAMNMDYGFTDNDALKATNTAFVAAGGHTGKDMNATGEVDFWWLRSPGYVQQFAARVNRGASVRLLGDFASNSNNAVRPALNLDLNSVLFTSAAVGGEAGNGLAAVKGYDGADWKMTVLDDSRADFAAACTKDENGVRTIRYSGAATGENEKISAMIVSPDGVVTYYGVLCDAEAGENTLTVDVSGKLNEGDALYIFNEQRNGDKKTDYASALVDVTLTIMPELLIDKADLKSGLNTNSAQTIWYGGSAWRVIGYDGAGVASSTGTMTLFADGSMGTSYFDFDGKTGRQYAGSDLEKQTNQIYNNAFSDPEQFAVQERTLNAGTYDGANTDGVAGSSVGYARLWPLSTKEANAVNANLRKDTGAWWLRSPGDGVNNVAFVKKEGDVDHIGQSFLSSSGVRPAFNVDINKVILASAAVGGKQGDGVLTPVEESIRGEWKLTLWESRRQWFTVTETEAAGYAGETVTLHYKYAETGENEYISAILTDAGGTALYYGRLAQPTAENGTVEIVIPSALPGGSYTLKVFNEQYNGDKKTDFSSPLIDVALTVHPGNGKALQMTEYGTAANFAGAQMSNVWFGNYKQSGSKENGFNVDPIKWRVLQNKDGRLFLLSDQNLDVFPYNKEATHVTWETCDMRSWLNGYGASANVGGNNYTADSFKGDAFSAAEYASIAVTDVENPDNTENEGNPIPGGNDTQDKVFLLSMSEADNAGYGFTDNNARISTNTAYVADGGKAGSPYMATVDSCDFWWLRSPSSWGSDAAAFVQGDGLLSSRGNLANWESGTARPALNIDLGKVLFTSAAKGGKQGDGLTAVPDYDGADWKLTLLDDRRDFAVSSAALTAAPGGTLSVDYTGASVGENEYISAIVTDETGAALYYGRLAQPTAADGTVEFTIPADLADGTYTLKVFSEQYNGDYKTDLASAPVDVTLTVEPLVTPDMTLEAESVTYGEECDVTVTLPDDATGTVSFKLTGKDDKNTYTYDDVALSGGKAELHEKLNADDYETVVTYSGDSQYAGAEGKITFVVEKAPTELEITTSPDTLAYGDTLRVTVTLSGGAVFSADQIDEQTGEPADGPGSVTISVDGKEYRTVTVDPDDVTIVLDGNVATLEVNGLTTGQHRIEAVFAGSDNYAGSTADAAVDIGMAKPELTVTLDPENPSVGETVKITATLSGNAKFVQQTTGSVVSGDGATLYLDGNLLGSASSDTNTVTFTVSNLYAGNHTVKVVFNGDANHAACETEQSFLVKLYEPQMRAKAVGSTCDKEVVITVTLPDDATGEVNFTIKGQKNNYTFNGIPVSGGKAEIRKMLNADDYMITANYSGDFKYTGHGAGTTLAVDKAPSEITVSTDKQTYTVGDNVVVTVTIPQDAEQPDGAAGNVTLKLDGQELTSIKVENGTGTYTIPSVGQGDHTVTATFNGDSHYASSETTVTFSVGCAHVWKEPTWDWTQDVKNPTYTAQCNNCTGKATGAVKSEAGDRVEATVDEDAYTPYTAKVTLGEQTFQDTFKAYEPGTAFEAYKQAQKKAAGDKALDGDSDECAQLIADAKDRIDDVQFNENNTLQQNKDAVDEAANLAGLEKALTDQRAADAVEKKIDAIGEVTLTDASKQKIDDARKAYDDLTDAQKDLVDNLKTLTDAEKAYQQLADKDAFDKYKDAQKQAAEDKRLPDDSDESKQLIDDAIEAIDAVTYDETKSLDDNKKAVDDAANFTQLDKDLADSRAADAVEKKIDAIGEVTLTDASKQKIDDARKAYDDLTDAQKDLVDNLKTLTDAEKAYQQLADKDAFDKYKDAQKQAAEDKRLPDDSDESKQLIDDAIEAIDAVTYDETKSLDDNKKAVDDAANFTQLDADLAAHRAIHYAAFYADGKSVANVPYTIDTKSIDAPAVPDKAGYTGAWPAYTLTAGGVRIDAVYEAITYTATFVADGQTVGTAEYTVESTSIDEPAVPEKTGYTGKWANYTFDVGGITVNAVYTLIGNPSVKIVDYKSTRTVWFHRTLTFTADAADVPEGAQIRWYLNGEEVGAGETYTVEYPTDDYTIQAKIVGPDGEVFAESEVETVDVLNCFIVRLIVFLWELILCLVFHLSLPELSVYGKIWSLFAA